MIIISFLTLGFMLIWLIVSILAGVLGFAGLESEGSGYAALLMCGGIFSLVVWYQALVWGEPWFRYCMSVWT